MSNHSLTGQQTSGCAFAATALIAVWTLFSGPAGAAEERAAVSTINHAFATELGTGVYDIGGQSIFVVRVTPGYELREATPERPGIRLIMPIAAGSFDFNPLDDLEIEVPDHVDSLSVMPGAEFEFLRSNDWKLTIWVRAGASFSAGQSDGLLFGTGGRLSWEAERGGVLVERRHELLLAAVNYHSHEVPDDEFVRFRNAVDLRRPTFKLSSSRRLMAGIYAIADVVTDPPDLPLADGEQSTVQFELGVTFNTEPRLQIRSWRLPRIGFGYRMAGAFSGWRIVVGAPF